MKLSSALIGLGVIILTVSAKDIIDQDCCPDPCVAQLTQAAQLIANMTNEVNVLVQSKLINFYDENDQKKVQFVYDQYERFIGMQWNLLQKHNCAKMLKDEFIGDNTMPDFPDSIG